MGRGEKQRCWCIRVGEGGGRGLGGGGGDKGMGHGWGLWKKKNILEHGGQVLGISIERFEYHGNN